MTRLVDKWRPVDRDGYQWVRRHEDDDPAEPEFWAGYWGDPEDDDIRAVVGIEELEAMLWKGRWAGSPDSHWIRHAFGMPVETVHTAGWRYTDPAWSCEIDGNRYAILECTVARLRAGEGLSDDRVSLDEIRKAFGIATSPAEPEEKPVPEPPARCEQCGTEGDPLPCAELPTHDLRELWPDLPLRSWPVLGGCVQRAQLRGVAEDPALFLWLRTWDGELGQFVEDFEMFEGPGLEPFDDEGFRARDPGQLDALRMALAEPPTVPEPQRSRHIDRPTPWAPETL